MENLKKDKLWICDWQWFHGNYIGKMKGKMNLVKWLMRLECEYITCYRQEALVE